ncbi:hypothetical protein Glove_21g186 [Diversispora epigaea]|uniref:Uncharacterized protein n=1 Tax=Diversispora epigaea TaxID=1348612 RepID=A0A397JLC1_9GLOM|nr:hypothetical protein Glove_21g186 [Diversispora epigaea]
MIVNLGQAHLQRWPTSNVIVHKRPDLEQRYPVQIVKRLDAAQIVHQRSRVANIEHDSHQQLDLERFFDVAHLQRWPTSNVIVHKRPDLEQRYPVQIVKRLDAALEAFRAKMLSIGNPQIVHQRSRVANIEHDSHQQLDLERLITFCSDFHKRPDLEQRYPVQIVKRLDAALEAFRAKNALDWKSSESLPASMPRVLGYALSFFLLSNSLHFYESSGTQIVHQRSRVANIEHDINLGQAHLQRWPTSNVIVHKRPDLEQRYPVQIVKRLDAALEAFRAKNAFDWKSSESLPASMPRVLGYALSFCLLSNSLHFYESSGTQIVHQRSRVANIEHDINLGQAHLQRWPTSNVIVHKRPDLEQRYPVQIVKRLDASITRWST